MELYAYDAKGKAVMAAYGAYFIEDGAKLRCPLTFVAHGADTDSSLLIDHETGQEIKVKMPDVAKEKLGHLRFDFWEFEVIK